MSVYELYFEYTNKMHIYNTCIIINTLLHVPALIASYSGRTLLYAQDYCYIV